MNPHQPIYNIAALCAAHGLTEVVLSPGSRCAPLTLAFARHPATNVRVVPDERAAAFIGLGIAQARRVPTVLVCTSGSAGLNYAPAVAEAYYQQVPLLILTADRPPEWIDQLDGQTIRQNGMYGPHVKGAYTFPTDLTHPDAKWHANRLLNEAINLAKAYPPGPVHVNIPLREPLYPTGGVEFEEVRVIKDASDGPIERIWWPRKGTADLADLLANSLVVVGQLQVNHRDTSLLHGELAQFADATKSTIVGDVISNAGNRFLVQHHDIFLSSSNEGFLDSLQPKLLITLGKTVISKALKQFLRKHPPQQHWHLQDYDGPAADVFGTLSQVIRVDLRDFLHELAGQGNWNAPYPSPLGKYWHDANQKAGAFLQEWFSNNSKWTEFQAIKHLLDSDLLRGNLAAPHLYHALHLANSMAVRYANILGVPPGVEVFANRGTSGIDGCTSTAVGYALAQPDKQVVLITGDVAFFYDRNAFWHNYPTPNLRVVLLNNHGGGIFRIIDGPRQQPELDEFFETRQQLTAGNLCRDFNLPYFPVDSMAKLEAALPVFFGPEGKGGVLEIQTDSKVNAAFFEEYRAAVKQAFS